MFQTLVFVFMSSLVQKSPPKNGRVREANLLRICMSLDKTCWLPQEKNNFELITSFGMTIANFG